MLGSDFLATYYKRKDPFKTLLARSTYLGKYRRDGETWTDTIVRVVLGSVALDPNTTQEEAELLFDIFWNGYGLPPGRGLWTGGVEGIPVSSFYNCHYVTLRSVDDWCYVANMLMCGGGVGVGLQHIDELPPVTCPGGRLAILCSKSHPNVDEVMPDGWCIPTRQVVLVEDSRLGWVSALRRTLEAAFMGVDIVVNVSSVRARGQIIKTFGGTACGPGPLVTLLRQVWAIVRGAAGRHLTSVECLDITNHIGVCIKSGNVRRSALIQLAGADDRAFRDAKKDWQAVMAHRHSSNNSIILDSEQQIDSFNWDEVVEDNAEFGEPGILNLWKIRQTDPAAAGVNPCWSKDSRIHTRQGHFEIQDLVGRTVQVWDGNSWRTVSTFRKTSENEPMLRVSLQDGSSFRVTRYHILVTETGKRVEAKDATPGARLLISNAPRSHGQLSEPGAYVKGFLVGDGTQSSKDRPILWLYPPKYGCQERLCTSLKEIQPDQLVMRSDCIVKPSFSEEVGGRKTMRGLRSRSQSLGGWGSNFKKSLPKEVFQWDLHSKMEFIAGYMDADGSAPSSVNGFCYQISSVEKKFLLDFQELLKTVGVHSRLGIMKYAGTVDLNDGYGEYKTQDCWRLTISQCSAVALSEQVEFSRLQSFRNRSPRHTVKQKFNKIVAIEEDGVDKEVFCLVTDDPEQISCSNGLIIGRCGEVPLEDREACCLSEIYPALFPPRARTNKILQLVTRYTLRQRLRPMEDPRADRVRRMNMRIGVGLGGICDFDWNCLGLGRAYSVVYGEARRYANELDVVQPIAVTTVKPSGTISLLNGSSPGIHAPFANHYIRRTRIGKHEPMAQALLDARVPHEPCVYDSTGQTLVFSFPMSSRASVTVQNQTVRDQIERQVEVQKFWADNSVSSTISFKEDEKVELAGLLQKHVKDLKSISCLPQKHGYAQPPYETITEGEYHRLHALIDHNHPLTAGGELDTLECEGGVCPVK